MDMTSSLVVLPIAYFARDLDFANPTILFYVRYGVNILLMSFHLHLRLAFVVSQILVGLAFGYVYTLVQKRNERRIIQVTDAMQYAQSFIFKRNSKLIFSERM